MTPKPRPLLVIGLTGHRSVPSHQDLDRATRQVLGTVLAACRNTVGGAAAFFADEGPRLRVVSMLAEGADLVVTAAAADLGAETRVVLPYDAAQYEKEIAQASHADFARLLAASSPILVLDGLPGEPRAYERANKAILERCDILLAFWDGKPARGRGGTAEVVQQAVDRQIPVILLPASGDASASMIADPEERLLPPSVLDLPRLPFEEVIGPTVERLLAPPFQAEERQALQDCFAERTARTWRFGYRLMMTLGPTRPAKPDDPADGWGAVAAMIERAGGDERDFRLLASWHGLLDRRAAHYAEMARSGVVYRYGLTTASSLIIAVIALLGFRNGWTSTIAQGVIAGLTMAESAVAKRRRWKQRWLDYRALAERLRHARFALPLSVDPTHLGLERAFEDPPWMAWFATRLLRQSWLGGRRDAAFVSALSAYVSHTEMAAQIGYHERTVATLSAVDRRLKRFGIAALGLMIVFSVTVSLLVSAGWVAPSWTVAVSLALVVLPALYVGSSGLRTNADLERSVGRSAESLEKLRALRLRFGAVEMDYDRLQQAAIQAARAQVLDNADWRVAVQRALRSGGGSAERTEHTGLRPAWLDGRRLWRRTTAASE